MDSHPLFPFSWQNDGTPFDQQVHSLSGRHSQIPPTPSVFEPSYQTPFAAHLANEVQLGNEVSMGNNDEGSQPASAVYEVQPGAGFPNRGRGERLDWNAHKDKIRELYVEQNNSLPETMEAMKEVYSFDASQKLYKTKFKEWNWHKNLSADTALKMAEKAKRRKREEGKDTVFSFGGKVWDSQRIENTLGRTKKANVTIDLIDAATPEGVSYKTPKALVESPAKSVAEHLDAVVMDTSKNGPENDSDDAMDVVALGQGSLALRWHGYSRTDLQEMWRTALKRRDAGKFDEAEYMLSQVLIGLCHVLGKTNNDTVKVAYNLADLYANCGQMEEAVDLLEKMIQNHLSTYGYGDKRTQQNILHTVELLNGWNREADALGLLSLSEELLESSSGASAASKAEADKQARKRGKASQKSSTIGPHSDLSGVTQSVLEESSPAAVDYGLGVARTHIAAKNQATEGLLLAIISQCERKPELGVQYLKALAELLKLYGKLGHVADHEAEFRDALDSLKSAWEGYTWEEDLIESFDFMEAALQLVANVLKYGDQTKALIMFREASEKSTEIFGWEDERNVWVNITIGLVYQTHMSWAEAEEWFEQAYSAALANEDWGPKDGIVRSLQNALDHHHFSYVSDEGRPFKTIFGVSGIAIRPGRLHLE